MLLLAAIFTLIGCGDELARLDISADTYLYTPNLNLFDELNTFDTQAEVVEASEVTDPPETTEVQETTAAQDNVASTVYWVSSGEVWHLNQGCSSLSRSKNILSGTVEAAMAAGKTRVCKKCGG